MQRADEFCCASVLKHRAHDESTSRISAAVVHANPRAGDLYRHERLNAGRLPVKPDNLVFRRHEKFPRFTGEREGPGSAGCGPVFVNTSDGVVAVDCPAVDVDPIQHLLGDGPHRALAQIGRFGGNDFDVGHGLRLCRCRQHRV